MKTKTDGGEMPSASVPATATHACQTRDPRERAWVESSVWTERMLAALVTGSTRRLRASPALARSRSPGMLLLLASQSR